MKKAISVFMAIILIVLMLAGCGNKYEGINRAQVNYPVPTDAEAAVDSAAGLAVDYYLTGRAYLDKFLNFDVSTLNEDNYDEYVTLVQNCIKAFENADKVNDVLNEALDVFENEPAPEGPAYKELSMGSPKNFGMTAYAAEMGSVEWAQSIMDEYAKAKPGYAIRHLASQLGTDAKHAYAQMKIAQDVLMGAEYTQIADKANTAVKTATVLKTAGTAAGLVIAVATAPASGALATAVSTGGITMSGVNTVLEIGSTASILYTNGEDNEFSMACDKTESQLAPIGQIFAIAGVGANIKDLTSAGKEIWKNGYKSLTPQAQQDLAMNTFGVISYGASSVNDYVNGGSIMSGTFTHTDEGIKFTLADTLTGSEPKQQEAVKTVLKETGMSSEGIKQALENKPATEKEENQTAPADPKTTAKPEEQPVTMTTGNMPNEIANTIIQKNQPIMDDFDLDAYLNLLRNVLYEIAGMAYEEEYTEKYENFIGEICGTYLVSGTGVLTGGAVYDDEGPETTFTKLALHVLQADGNAVQIDVEGEHAGSGEVNADSPSVTYTDSMGYEVTVTFVVTDGVAHADMRIFGDLSIEDTGERCTETITLSGDK